MERARRRNPAVRAARAALQRAYRIAHPQTDYMKAWMLKNRYGLSPAEAEFLLAFQGGRCAVCHKPLVFKTFDCTIDHDHNTHRVRGILCQRCNRGFGYFKNNPTTLERAILYLEDNQ